MKPLVSVIIPNYNYSRYVSEAVESVLAQTYAPIEILIVDDGSTDDSLAVISRFGDRIKLVAQKNQGVSAARNNGIKASTGTLIAFLDADDVWRPEKIEAQVGMFDSDPELGAVFVGIQEIDPEGKPIREHIDGSVDDLANDLLLWKDTLVLGGGSGCMVRRDVLEEVGGFDQRLMTSADWDLYYRVSRKYKAGFVPHPYLRYRYHSTNMHGNVQRMEREMGLFYEKAFQTEDADVLRLKRKAYGNYHRVLAGSYLHAGRWGKFVEHSAKSILNRPGNLGYFLAFPLRRLR